VVAEEVPAAHDILIRNATLIDPSGASPDRKVSLLVRDGKLEIVTEDTIPTKEAGEIVNADAGFIIGNLEIGAAPSFMILSLDPREDFEALLDTKTYASFAMHDGSKWNRWETKYISGIFLSGLVIDRINWLSQDAASEGVVGDLSAFEGGEIRGFRIGAAGTLNMFDRPWVYTIFGATNAFDKGFNEEGLDDFAWLDWRLDIPFIANTVLSVGKQKEPISGERVQSLIFNHMQERTAVSDAFLPSRNVGIVWSGAGSLPYSTWAVGVFNDWFDAPGL
jgi:phosphate-selective porin OprO/OprP